MDYDLYILEIRGNSKPIVGRFHSIFDLGIQDNVSKVVLAEPKPSKLIGEKPIKKAKITEVPFYSEIILLVFCLKFVN